MNKAFEAWLVTEAEGDPHLMIDIIKDLVFNDLPGHDEAWALMLEVNEGALRSDAFARVAEAVYKRWSTPTTCQP